VQDFNVRACAFTLCNTSLRTHTSTTSSPLNTLCASIRTQTSITSSHLILLSASVRTQTSTTSAPASLTDSVLSHASVVCDLDNSGHGHILL